MAGPYKAGPYKSSAVFCWLGGTVVK